MRLRQAVRFVWYVNALGIGAVLAQWGGRSQAELTQTTAAAVRSVLSVDRAHAAANVELRAPPEAAEPAPAPKPPDSTSYAGGRIIDGSTPHRLILFTFDDGPERRTTPLLLDRLDAVGIKALFFLTASRIAGRTPVEREQAALAKEIVARGHLVGSHTVDHLQLPLLDDTGATAQVLGAEQIFQRVLGFRPTLIRPPGGARSPRIDGLLAERDYTTVLWNLGAGDFQVKSANEVLDTFRKVLERRERENGDHGGILLLHDTYAWSVDAFQLIWAELWARNCKLLERREELYDIVSDLQYFFQPRDGAAVGTIALPARLPTSVFEERQAKLRRETAQRCAATDGF
jgi:peptidoglycan/xylan/chitin deacetylase (PgdA/CDA1 family)